MMWSKSLVNWQAPICLSLLLVFAGPPAHAQEKKDGGPPPAEEAPKPVTTADPDIPVDQLDLLVLPLTKVELIVEANAWRDLLKQKVQQISQGEIAVKRQNQEIASAKKEKEKVTEEAKTKASDKEEVKQKETAAEAKTKKEEEQKQELLADLPALRDQKAKLIDRLNVVLDDLAAKGGDDKEYRDYVTAVSGINVDVSDASATWSAITGWVTSEQGGVRWAWNIVKFLSIVVAFYLLGSILSLIAWRAVGAWKNSSALLRDFTGRFVKQFTFLIGVVVALTALEINITPLLAVIGAAGFVIGLALQGTLSNFASGLLLLAYRPFDIGDVVDAGGVNGTVESMNMLSTHIKTADNKHVIVPNNAIWGGKIINSTSSDKRRVDMKFTVSAEGKLEKAQEILERVAKEHPLTLDNPPPLVRLSELSDGSVTFICRPWVKPGDYSAVQWDITRKAKEEFDRNGLTCKAGLAEVL